MLDKTGIIFSPYRIKFKTTFMQSTRFTFFLVAFLASSSLLHSQVTAVPEQAKQSFFKQYPDARNVKWGNNLVNVNVRFEQDSSKMNAEYNNKGIWKNTLKDWSYDNLPEDVKEGFKKSKFADREVTDVKVVYFPGYVIQYRLRADKIVVEKKFLYFNTEGRMVRSAVTL
jgi:hypothetical protein